jgi:predicted small lipoprotein YifL
MVVATQGALSLSPLSKRPLFHLALIGALAVTLGLAGCGRKGPLDPPPGASLDGVPQANMPDLMNNNSGAAPIGGKTQDGHPGVGPDGQPLAPKGPEKSIFLDRLLN